MPLRSALRHTPPNKRFNRFAAKNKRILLLFFFDFLTLKVAMFYNSQNRVCLADIKIRLIKLLITAKINAEDEACNLEENF